MSTPCTTRAPPRAIGAKATFVAPMSATIQKTPNKVEREFPARNLGRESAKGGDGCEGGRAEWGGERAGDEG